MLGQKSKRNKAISFRFAVLCPRYIAHGSKGKEEGGEKRTVLMVTAWVKTFDFCNSFSSELKGDGDEEKNILFPSASDVNN